jgi:hypothetical protein
MSEFVFEVETFTTVSCNEITMKWRTNIDVGVLAEAGQVYFDLSVAADIVVAAQGIWYNTSTTTAIHYKKERRPTALRREKKEEQGDTEGHQGEEAGEKEETDWEETEGKEREEA